MLGYLLQPFSCYLVHWFQRLELINLFPDRWQVQKPVLPVPAACDASDLSLRCQIIQNPLGMRITQVEVTHETLHLPCAANLLRPCQHLLS